MQPLCHAPFRSSIGICYINYTKRQRKDRIARKIIPTYWERKKNSFAMYTLLHTNDSIMDRITKLKNIIHFNALGFEVNAEQVFIELSDFYSVMAVVYCTSLLPHWCLLDNKSIKKSPFYNSVYPIIYSWIISFGFYEPWNERR